MIDYSNIFLSLFCVIIIILIFFIIKVKYNNLINTNRINTNNINTNHINTNNSLNISNNNVTIDIVYEKTEYCLICIENNSNVILYPCNHYIICYNCMSNLHLYNLYRCPLCRSNIISYRKMVNHIEPVVVQR
jgi:hypothetical protein